MIGSILIDFAKNGDDKLVRSVLIEKFTGELETLSKDKVVPVRLEVARIYGELFHQT